jgi:Multiubiquitin
MPDSEVATHEEAHREHRDTVIIVVNEQSVEVPGPKITGLEIKVAAVAQGAPIDVGFQLIEELSHGRTRVVGNDEVVTVHSGSRFLALAPDDNS